MKTIKLYAKRPNIFSNFFQLYETEEEMNIYYHEPEAEIFVADFYLSNLIRKKGFWFVRDPLGMYDNRKDL